MKTRIIISIIPLATLATDIPPIVYEISSTTDASSLSAECSFTSRDNKTINCRFVQVSLRRPDVDTAKMIKQAYSDISTMKKYEIKKAISEACSTLNTDRIKITKGSSREIFLNEMKDACAEKDEVAAAQKMSRANIMSEKSKCRISHNEYEMAFKRMGKFKWVSDSSPKGICEISTVATLESKNGIAWKYTQVRMGVGNDTLALCKGYDVGKPIEYNWEAETEFSLDGCKTLTVGGL